MTYWTIFGIVLFGGIVAGVLWLRQQSAIPYLTDKKRDRAGSGATEAERSGIRKQRRR